MATNIELRPFDATTREMSEQSAYIGWTPVRLTVIGENDSGKPNVVTLSSRSLTPDNTRLVFKVDATAEPADEIQVNLGDDGRATCFVAGKFQEGNRHNGASPDGKDVALEAAWADDPAEIKGSLPFMIRVRRNAEHMSDKARDDFTRALGELNGHGRGIYVTDFVAMHVAGASDSQHGDTHFLPWHRLYLLDLERLLQRVNPAVTLPYWRFDEPAPRLFSEEFLGATDHIPFTSESFTPGTSGGVLARFTSGNRLSDWKIGNTNGIERVAFFDTKNDAAAGWPNFRLISEAETLALGGDANEFGFRRPARGFARMEGTPHGAAHVSFNGPINNVPTAPEDPLFFLLHCNVDRLWSKWQFTFERDGPTQVEAYPFQNEREISFTTPTHLVGLFPREYTFVEALQWPWDDTWAKPHNLRPPGTRSRNFTASRTGKEIIEGMPALQEAIDAYGYHPSQASLPNTFVNYLGFAYDDVPFDHERARA